jgi:hypothetical protein
MATEELSGEEMLQQAALQLEEPENPVDDPVDPAEPVELDDPADPEAIARESGWVPYEEWKAAGHDPRAWRPADEYNRRGELLQTPKRVLVKQVEELSRRSEEQAALLKEQLDLSRKQVEMAEKRGREEAIREARRQMHEAQEKKEAAWATGNKQLFEEAAAEEMQAKILAAQATAQPVITNDLQSWAHNSPWYTNGFTPDNKPATPVVAEFLQYQKEFMDENPGATVMQSVKFAEKIVKAKYGDLNAPPKPAAVPAPRRASAVDPGTRAVSRAASDNPAFEKLSREEQDIVRRMAKASGMDLKTYMKEYK